MHNNHSLPKERLIRVFVSSTFRDMQEERDVLVKKVFPQLRKLCEERAVAWTEVDLRWGITDRESSEGKVLPLCLAEIERCHPFFIGLLGERYGWVPDGKALGEEIFETQPWLEKYPGTSVTELEIIHGVLEHSGLCEGAFFYFRDPAYADRLPAGFDPDDFRSESPVSAVKLARLKNAVRKAFESGKLPVSPREGYPSPDALGELVLADFTSLIDRRFPFQETPDPFEQESLQHQAYAENRRFAFYGRNALLLQLDRYADSDSEKPLVLNGVDGCGKSALLAEWVYRRKMTDADTVVIEHYIGSSAASADWKHIVRRVIKGLQRALHIDGEIPVDTGELRMAIRSWMVKVPDDLRIVIVIDGLNQLSSDDASASQFGWLPLSIPGNFRLIVSTSGEKDLALLLKRQWQQHAVPFLDTADISPAASAFLGMYGKKPSEALISMLRDASVPCSSPLFLRSVLDELRQFGLHEQLERRASEYLSATDLHALFDLILSRWDDDFGHDPDYPDLVRRTMRLIACSRFGLSENELLGILGKDDDSGQRQSLPRRFWSPLYLAAENAFANRSGLLAFGHDYLHEAVETMAFACRGNRKSVQLELIAWFNALPANSGRRLDELPVLLRDTGLFEKLREFLADPDTFMLMYEHPRRMFELHEYWQALKGLYDPASCYRDALSLVNNGYTEDRCAAVNCSVGKFLYETGNYHDAGEFLGKAYELLRKRNGDPHENTVFVMNLLAAVHSKQGSHELARKEYEHLYSLYDNGILHDSSGKLAVVSNLAQELQYLGDYPETERLYRDTLALYTIDDIEQDEGLLSMKHNLAGLLQETGRISDARKLFTEVLDAREKLLGEDHPDTLVTVNALGLALKIGRQYAEAARLYRRALSVQYRLFGADHPETLIGFSNLASLLKLEGKKGVEAAERIYRRALDRSERVHGYGFDATLLLANNLAIFFREQGRPEDAEPYARRVLEQRELRNGKSHPDTLLSYNTLARILETQGRNQDAEPFYRQALEGILSISREMNMQHPFLPFFTDDYTRCLRKTGMDEAVIGERIEKL